MFRTFITVIVLAVGCDALVAQAQTPATMAVAKPSAEQPDLRIREIQFLPGNDKAMKVQVSNAGTAPSRLCVLRLTVRKINGISVGRVKEVKLPPLAPGGVKWVVVDAKSILPNNISLEATTFKINADATEIIAESNETNNELWHNL